MKSQTRAVGVCCLIVAVVGAIGAATDLMSNREEAGSPPSVELGVTALYVVSYCAFRGRVRITPLAIASLLIAASICWDVISYYSQLARNGVSVMIATKWASPEIYFTPALITLFIVNACIQFSAYTRR